MDVWASPQILLHHVQTPSLSFCTSQGLRSKNARAPNCSTCGVTSQDAATARRARGTRVRV
eukprot:992393-Prorocentrum_minimum.AAC.3